MWDGGFVFRRAGTGKWSEERMKESFGSSTAILVFGGVVNGVLNEQLRKGEEEVQGE